MAKVESIDSFSKKYYNLSEEDRNESDWVPILESYLYAMCMKYPMIDRDEAFQEAWIGAVKAIRTFDPSKNFKLTTYLSVCVINQFRIYLRHNGKHFDNLSLDAEYKGEKSRDGCTLLDILPNKVQLSVEDKNIIDLFKKYLETIPSSQKEVVTDFYFNDKRQVDIGRKYNLSQAQVSRICKKHIGKFQKSLRRRGKSGFNYF